MIDFTSLSIPILDFQEDRAFLAAIESFTASLKRQYFTVDRSNDPPIRVSSLGKPGILQALALPHIKQELELKGLYQPEEMSNELRHMCFYGDLFETYLTFILPRLGFEVWDEQRPVEFEGVPGHTDLVVKDPKGTFYLLECKTMGDRYFSAFTNRNAPYEVLDQKGYLTQLAVYAEMTGLPAYWVCMNRANHKIALVPYVKTYHDAVLDRARKLIKALREVETVADIPKSFKAPAGEPEVFKKELTGRMKMSETVRYSQFADLLYHIKWEENGYKKLTPYCGFNGETHYRNLEEL